MNLLKRLFKPFSGLASTTFSIAGISIILGALGTVEASAQLANSYEAVKIVTDGKRYAEAEAKAAAEAKLKEFIYNGTVYKGEVLEVIPATVKIKSADGRVATLFVDYLDLKFASDLNIVNNPYTRLLKALTELKEVGLSAPPAPAQQKPVPIGVLGRNRIIDEKQLEDIKVEIVSAQIAPMEFKDIMGRSQRTVDKVLLIRLKITNTSTTKKMNYETWRGKWLSMTKDFASISDDFGNSYKRINTTTQMPLESVEGNDSIYPEKAITDTLVFEIPIDSAKTLTLDMPGENIAQRESIKFTIPIQAVGK